jgi:cytochrome o ubiquinol oxidase subunit 3
MTAIHPEIDHVDRNLVGHGAHHEAPGHGEGGPAPARIIVGYGFWVFLLSDIVMFSCFFAAYAVLHGETAGGPTPRQLFSPTTVALETACLLASSFSCGLASLAAYAHYAIKFYAAMTVTFLLGLTFVVLEAREFADLVGQGFGPQRSAFLSAFFSLVGCHGAHVTVGLLWLLTMMAQAFAKGFRATILHRMMCFALFWHALDIIWVGLFTVVYLLGIYG